MAPPYRNIDRDIENEDWNADQLQPGIEDARHKLEVGSKVMQVQPSWGNEANYNGAIKNLIDKINAQGRIRSKARQLEIDKLPPKESRFEPSSMPSRDPSSVASVLQLAGGVQPAEAAKTTDTPGFHPPMAAPQQGPAQKAAAAVQELRGAGVGKIGDKASVEEKVKTDTRKINPNIQDIGQIAAEMRGLPEWQQQQKGLNDISHLLGLEAQRNAAKTSVDLSPIGAYEDMINSKYGTKSNLAKSWQMAPIEDTSIKDLSEVQRRRADMAKELINAVRATHVGQNITQDTNGNTWVGGLQVPKPDNGALNNRLANTQRQQFTQMGDKILENSNKQKAGLDSLGAILGSNNPASIGRVPLKRAVADVAGNGRVNMYDMFVESGSQAFITKNLQKLETLKSGKMTPENLDLLTDALYDDMQQWKTDRKNKIGLI